MEKSSGSEEAGGPPPPLPPPPPTIPPNVKLEQVTTTKYTITSKHGVGTTSSSYKSVPRAFSCKSVERFV